MSGHRASQFNDTVARAIDEDQLPLAYQPIVSLVTGRIWAFEALLRYVHPELGAISPPSLVEKAKNLGRFDKLTSQIAEKAMIAAAEFRLVEPGIVCMTINVEAGQLAPERLGRFVEDLNNRYPEISLCLELNELGRAGVRADSRAGQPTARSWHPHRARRLWLRRFLGRFARAGADGYSQDRPQPGRRPR
nr:EAL domain-containing protein [Cryobacterium aureum]